jgi:hypothetical protein
MMGQKQAAYDATGAIVAFYDSIDSPAPAGAQVIAITEAEWLDCLNNQGSKFVENGVLADVPPPSDAELLAAAQAAKIAELSAACKASIVAGFTSSALGAAYTYPAKDTDQQNLASSVIDSLLSDGAAGWVTPFWCADAAGSWAFRMHSVAQIQKVGQDAKAAVLASMAKNQALVGQVAAASTVAAVNAIAWG